MQRIEFARQGLCTVAQGRGDFGHQRGGSRRIRRVARCGQDCGWGLALDALDRREQVDQGLPIGSQTIDDTSLFDSQPLQFGLGIERCVLAGADAVAQIDKLLLHQGDLFGHAFGLLANDIGLRLCLPLLLFQACGFFRVRRRARWLGLNQ